MSQADTNNVPSLDQLSIFLKEALSTDVIHGKNSFEIFLRMTFFLFLGYTTILALQIVPWFLVPLGWMMIGACLFGLRAIVSACSPEVSVFTQIMGTLCSIPLLLPFETSLLPNRDVFEYVNNSKLWMFASFLSWKKTLVLAVQGRRRYTFNLLLVWTAIICIFPLLVCKFGFGGLLKFYLIPWLIYHLWYASVIKLKWSALNMDWELHTPNTQAMEMRMAEWMEMVKSRFPEMKLSDHQVDILCTSLRDADAYLASWRKSHHTYLQVSDSIFGYDTMTEVLDTAIAKLQTNLSHLLEVTAQRRSSQTQIQPDSGCDSTENKSCDTTMDNATPISTTPAVPVWTWVDPSGVTWDAQPACFLTDYVLSLQCFAFAAALHWVEYLPWQANHTLSIEGATSAWWYCGYFIASGLASLCGAIVHHVAYDALTLQAKHRDVDGRSHQQIIDMSWAGVQFFAALSNFFLISVWMSASDPIEAESDSESYSLRTLYSFAIPAVVYLLYGAYSIMKRDTILLTIGFIPPLFTLGYTFARTLSHGCSWAAHGLSSLLLIVFGGLTQFLQVGLCRFTFNHNAVGHIIVMFAELYMFLSAYRHCVAP
eukprot:TRINITY_DN14785_c0_g1::TRINITY_DN14785_c0_g1_i1::g.30227::m.30227 TRINITY_DN14785_c0_g1::TRINITY_DN14785_c0_g1_i1::g.30227  ORF type:complete len:596 (-),score=104.66,Tubulin_C/PF03953.12/0.15 TRINITY_DN14785_c0_g1_i1:344-2131(-)